MKDTSENTFYELKKFKYFLNDKVLKGNDVSITTNINGEKSDKFYFKDLFTNIKKKNFKASKTEILFHKSIFDKEREKFIDLENASRVVPNLNEMNIEDDEDIITDNVDIIDNISLKTILF